ncbi:hypothetical protein N008_17955 [Hymenobacter sp. APR13]|nr:hypothetical protein N008_17955 [Hymenobacter sp. APR13]
MIVGVKVKNEELEKNQALDYALADALCCTSYVAPAALENGAAAQRQIVGGRGLGRQFSACRAGTGSGVAPAR